MGEEISKEIAVDGVDVRELYGAQNVYLEQIRALHPALKIVARGSSLKVLGAKSAAERFERRMQGLIDYYLTAISRARWWRRRSPRRALRRTRLRPIRT